MAQQKKEFARVQIDRRRLLLNMQVLIAASAAPSLFSPLGAARPTFPAALLIPRTGPHAALGRSMERAALLAQGDTDKGSLIVLDTGGTPAGAANAAKQAKRRKAAIVLGPVFSAEVGPVLRELGTSIPVMTFSNDLALIEAGAFVFGITARQYATTVLRYAASRGIRRIAVGGNSTGWGLQVRTAAIAVAGELGLAAVQLPTGSLTGLPVEMPGSTDGMPDAVLMTDTGSFVRMAPTLKSRGIQLLGAFQGLDLPPEALGMLDGAWLAAPDPAGFAGFARAFEQRNGSRPGLIAGLAYDAVNIVRTLRQGGGTDRSALMALEGFKGVCGEVRFRDNGSVARGLAVLAVSGGKVSAVAQGSPA